jgi:hypothetical protein
MQAAGSQLTDGELVAKIALTREKKRIRQISRFAMFEMPTGSDNKGLGAGKAWFKLTICLEKHEGKPLV